MTTLTSSHLDESVGPRRADEVASGWKWDPSSTVVRGPQPTSTLGGRCLEQPSDEDDDPEMRAWAQMAREASTKWAKENPY
jgi:hypothetical protein